MPGLSIVSWDSNNINDGTNYSASFSPADEWGLPEVQANISARIGQWPLVTTLKRKKHRLRFWIKIEDSTNIKSLREDLMRWFDPEDETVKVFAIEDAGGGDTRFVYAICEQITPVIDDGLAVKHLFSVVLAVHDDVRWRSTAAVSDVWAITASGQTNVLNNEGTDDAFPIFTIKPTSALTGGYPYKVWIPIRWRVSKGYKGYPIDIVNNGFDTATLVSGAKMQSDGDDLRVEVDGVEVDRWLQDINDATTQVWCNLDFQAKQEVTLATAIAGAGAVSTIDVNESIKNFPSNGILMIESEAFSYTGKTEIDKQFTGCTRSINGTSAAAHAVDTTVWWCQHDVWIKYGDSTVSAPDVDDDYKPAFDLNSTNTSWVYSSFGDDGGKRTGAWYKISIRKNPSFYTANHDTDASPWSDIGVHVNSYGERGRWCLYNPCGITNINATNGEKYSTNLADWFSHIASSISGIYPFTIEYSIPAPSVASTWESWSQNQALDTGSLYVSVYARSLKNASYEHKSEMADAVVTLNNSNTPTLTVGSEQSSYTLDCIIENTTTGDQIEVVYQIDVNDELEVDTDAKTVTDNQTNLSAFQALTLTGGARKEWLPLQPGNNTITFTATGTNAVTLTTEWYKRWY